MTIGLWKVLGSQYLLENPWMTVRADHCETDQGVIVDPYFIHESCDWVHVLALNENNEVLLTRQYRHAAGEIILELPAGCVEVEEDPLTAMKRELLEETGCVASEYIKLAAQFSNPARCNNHVHPYLARGVKRIAVPKQDAAEHIESMFVTIPELLTMVDIGEFKAAMHVSAIYMGLSHAGLLEIND